MRKLLLIPLLLITSFILFGCNNIYEGEPTDLDILLMDEIVAEGSIEAYIVIPTTLESEDELTEIAYSAASLIYERNFNDVGQSHAVLTIYFYSSETSFDSEQNDFGYLIYDINLNEDSFGLKLQENNLIFTK
ncbi:MAG: hypothetical protein V3569_00265 [Acholeplasmataceae bacterium]|nr:hypothetical protein [Acholeplasmataceae bacterium]